MLRERLTLELLKARTQWHCPPISLSLRSSTGRSERRTPVDAAEIIAESGRSMPL